MISVLLEPMTREAADAIVAGRVPDEPAFADGYPTELSAGVARAFGAEGSIGPFFVVDAAERVVVGEIGGAYVEPGTVEIGYAIVEARAGRGYATAAVEAIAGLLRDEEAAARAIAHTPFDRPASARVLAKAGFAATEVVEDEDDGTPIRVQRWELRV